MIVRGGFTARRKVLLGVMVLLLIWLAWAWSVGMAITQGVEHKDMDWNGDGTISREEYLQAFYAVAVKQSTDGQRHCKTFYWRGSGEQIRVDCRTVIGVQQDTAQPRRQ